MVDAAPIQASGLGLRFYRNPNQAFQLKSMYRQFVDRHIHGYAHESQGDLFRWIWRDLDLKVHSGDILAIMGPNGEGKSTLLRVLAGLIRADEGVVQVSDRPFLLSTGLGFREELSGLDNIRLGGLFLGISLADIKRKTHQIADFAELTMESLQKPVKYYSEGMKARLIFSVATTTDRPLLFLDEILGAGDIGFQKKAKERMQQLMSNAKAIVLVSHNKEFVLETAKRGILLFNGRVQVDGDIQSVVKEYERVCG